jgi:hypothetical protein
MKDGKNNHNHHRTVAAVAGLVLLRYCCGIVSAFPVLPAEFYGAVTVDNASAPAGTTLTARINGVERGSFITTAEGSYGGPDTLAPRLAVSGLEEEVGQPVLFFINGVKAQKIAVFSPGTSTLLDLGPGIAANFTVNSTSGTVPMTVRFTDMSTSLPTAWNWSFGDGNRSTLQNPVNTYLHPGIFSVSLNASNSGGSDSTVRTGYITVYPKGDLNTNWRVDIGDVTRVAYMVVGLISQDPRADFHNGNGTVEGSDAAKIAWYYVGKIPEL